MSQTIQDITAKITKGRDDMRQAAAQLNSLADQFARLNPRTMTQQQFTSAVKGIPDVIRQLAAAQNEQADTFEIMKRMCEAYDKRTADRA